jgi:uncharacterized damage-inducible protein DinB
VVPRPFPSPTVPAAGRAEVFLGYLDYFREAVTARVLALPDDELRRSRLPSGWSPLELVNHLRYVELRWIEWGFQGCDVGDPWGDRRADRWYVEPAETRADLVAALYEQGEHTRRVVEQADLSATGAPGPRWDGADPASLERVLLHLLQEYARHLATWISSWNSLRVRSASSAYLPRRDPLRPSRVSTRLGDVRGVRDHATAALGSAPSAAAADGRAGRGRSVYVTLVCHAVLLALPSGSRWPQRRVDPGGLCRGREPTCVPLAQAPCCAGMSNFPASQSDWGTADPRMPRLARAAW